MPDVDGMHIRLLLDFVLPGSFSADLIRTAISTSSTRRSSGVRKRRKRSTAIRSPRSRRPFRARASHEITRFKGLGEISAGEFKDFIGENIGSRR